MPVAETLFVEVKSLSDMPEGPDHDAFKVVYRGAKPENPGAKWIAARTGSDKSITYKTIAVFVRSGNVIAEVSCAYKPDTIAYHFNYNPGWKFAEEFWRPFVMVPGAYVRPGRVASHLSAAKLVKILERPELTYALAYGVSQLFAPVDELTAMVATRLACTGKVDYVLFGPHTLHDVDRYAWMHKQKIPASVKI